MNFIDENNDKLINHATIITKEQFDLLKCEFCDEHIKRRFIELKETFFRIFKNFIKLIKLIKNKDDLSLRKIIEDTGHAQREFINSKNLLEKFIILRNSNKKLEYNKPIYLQGLEEKEKKDFFDELNLKKEALKKFRKNIIELENISNNIQNAIEMISLSNCLINN
jgi:hypothetical protein